MRCRGMPCSSQRSRAKWSAADLLVALVHGRPDALGIEPVRPRRELVRHRDRARLEVVAEREVAHHLEERHVALGRPDDVDVDGAEAALHRGEARSRRRRLAQEVRLEGLHAGGREQHRLVERRRYERGRGHGDVAALHEELRERAADLVGGLEGAHWSSILGGAAERGGIRRNRPHARARSCRCRKGEASRAPGGLRSGARSGRGRRLPERAATSPAIPRSRAAPIATTAGSGSSWAASSPAVSRSRTVVPHP